MTATTIPIEHIQLWLTIIAMVITVLAMCASAAWWGAKLAMKSYDVQLRAVVEGQTERKAAMIEMNKRIDEKVPITRCSEDRIFCGQNRTANFEDIGDQICNLTKAIDKQNEKREQSKDETHNMFMAIMDKISKLESKAAERRSGNGHDHATLMGG